MRYGAICLLTAMLVLIMTGCTTASNDATNPYLNPTGARDQAIATACMSNMRVIVSAEQAYRAQYQKYATLDELAKFMGNLPKEPAGGYYTINTDTGAVTCSKGHGTVSP